MAKCAALADPANSDWSFCPNVGAAYFFAIIFGITTCTHIAQAIIHRKFYCWVIAMSGLWQTCAYVFRILSIENPTSDSWYEYWFVLMMIAPLWTNAFIYMVMGRMVYNFTSTAKVFGIKAWRFGLYFVLLDIVAFLVQAYGAGSASGPHTSDHKALLGIHIYMGGVGAQQIFIFLFLFLAIQFHRTLRQESPTDRNIAALRLQYVLYAAITMITIRIIFRLIEYSKGIKSTIPNHEVYQYIFDSLPMAIALYLFNIFHPGRIMPGKESNLPSRKTRKMWKKQGIPEVGRGEAGLLPVTRIDLDTVPSGAWTPTQRAKGLTTQGEEQANGSISSRSGWYGGFWARIRGRS